ncbi:MAG: hypothetical protein ACK2U9_13310, partial [Anaerolineae bacterium]
ANPGAIDPSTGRLAKASYGINAWGSGFGEYGLANTGFTMERGVWVDILQIDMPCYFIAYGDSGEWPALCPTYEEFAPARRHLDGANMLFVDSHVEYAKFRDWVAQEAEIMSRWNRDHQPHPETWFEDLSQQ